jgi:hypothetical protein
MCIYLHKVLFATPHVRVQVTGKKGAQRITLVETQDSHVASFAPRLAFGRVAKNLGAVFVWPIPFRPPPRIRPTSSSITTVLALAVHLHEAYEKSFWVISPSECLFHGCVTSVITIRGDRQENRVVIPCRSKVRV